MGVEAVYNRLVRHRVLSKLLCRTSLKAAFDGVAQQIVGCGPTPCLQKRLCISNSRFSKCPEIRQVHDHLSQRVFRNPNAHGQVPTRPFRASFGRYPLLVSTEPCLIVQGDNSGAKPRGIAYIYTAPSAVREIYSSEPYAVGLLGDLRLADLDGDGNYLLSETPPPASRGSSAGAVLRRVPGAVGRHPETGGPREVANLSRYPYFSPFTYLPYQAR